MFVPGNSRVWLRRPFPYVLGLLLATVPVSCVVAATFAVNSQFDAVDANPGDGICRTAPGNTVCTLRAAIMETNSLAGADTINLQANTTYMLELPGTDDLGLNGDLDVLDSLTIVGAGPASSIIDGNGLVTGDRLMTVFNCIGVDVSGFGECTNGTIPIVAAISGVGVRRGRRLEEPGQGGGGLLNWGRLTIHSCAFTENVGVNGGGIKNWGTVAISNTTVAGNTAMGDIALFLGAGGGGIYSRGLGGMTLIDSTVRDNVLTGLSDSLGGGILLFSTTATISRSTVSNNTSNGFGGGIHSQSATLHLTNSTLSGNYSYRSGGGLGVNDGTVGLYNVTITLNIANADASGTTDLGGGVYREAGALTFRNSILTNNLHAVQGSGAFAPDECLGAIMSAGNNIVTAPNFTICGITGSYAMVTASLGPLQNNGGPTQTHALMMGSPAINAGNPAGCIDNVAAILTTDQRGEPRPVGPACDIGAFEASDTVFKDGFES